MEKKKKTIIEVIIFIALCIVLVTVVNFKTKDWRAYKAFTKGNESYDIKDYHKAIEFYNKALKIKNDYESAHYNLALSYTGTKDFNNAFNSLEKVSRNKDRAMAYIYYESGVEALSGGDFNYAIEMFKNTIKFDPNSEASYTMLGTCYNLIGDIENSIKYYEKAIEMDYGNSSSLLPPLATLYYRKGDILKAIKLYEEAIKISPDNDILYFSLAELYIESKEFHKLKALHIEYLKNSTSPLTIMQQKEVFKLDN